MSNIMYSTSQQIMCDKKRNAKTEIFSSKKVQDHTYDAKVLAHGTKQLCALEINVKH